MHHVKLLLKRDAIESIYGNKQKKDLLGFFSSVFLLIVIYGVFVYVFSHFARLYIETDFGNASARYDRLLEFLTLCFSGVFILNVIIGVKKLYSIITNSKDTNILIFQPIETGSIYMYKLLKVYISQLISSLFIITPISIVMDIVSPLVGGIGYYLLTLLIIVLLPLITTAIASLLALPSIAIIKRIASKFLILLLIYIGIVFVGFIFYGAFLKLLSELVRSGNLKYVFELSTINKINKITSYAYPCKFFSDILLNNNILLNVFVVFSISSLAVLVSYFVVKKVYLKVVQDQLEGNSLVYRNNAKLKMHSPTMALLKKEFIMVLRTPSYAFQYFAMAITMPFMVYTCAFLLESMLSTLTIINCNYALAIFVVSMFSILTNNFCTTNISRDGKMFALLKTMPVTVKKVVSVKLLFCSIVSFVSVLVSSLVLYVTGFLSLGYFIITFVIGFLFSLVQIAYGTRKDMKNPCFPNNNQEEIIEGNSNMSTLIVGGLITTIIAGGGSVLLSVIIGMKYNEKLAALLSIGFVFLITIVTLIIACIYLFKGLEKEYYSME